MTISAKEVVPREEVIIRVKLTNKGNGTGTKTLDLIIGEQINQSKVIKLKPDKSVFVNFTIIPDDIREYNVSIDKLHDTFRVLHPAEFVFSYLNIHPKEAGPNENVVITVQIENIGEINGSTQVPLIIDNETVQTEIVYLDAKENTSVEFIVQREDKKFYQVKIESLVSRFEIVPYLIVDDWGGQGGGGGNFNYPTGLAVDNQGSVYVTDTLNNRVQKFDENGTFITMWGKTGYGPGEFESCIDIDVEDGYVYVVSGNHRFVQKFTDEGNYLDRWEVIQSRAVALNDGEVYVGTKNAVNVYDVDGYFLRSWGSEGTDNGQFTKISGLDVDDDFVYVVELDREGNNRLQIFSHEGEFLEKWELTPTSSSWWPMVAGVSVDKKGNVYLTNPYSSSITKYDSKGNILKEINSRGSGFNQIKNPQGICVHNSTVYLSDRGNYRIKKLDLDLSSSDTWGSFGGDGEGYFNMPIDCDIGTTKNQEYLFVNEFWNSRVQVFHLNGSFLYSWGTQGRGSGEFDNPEAIEVDKNGFVYVSDSGNSRVQKFTVDGKYVTEWGERGAEDGNFRRNVGIASDPSGNYVYVVDMGEYRVQKFTSNGDFVFHWHTESPDVGEYSPRGIDVDTDGFVYVSEQGASGKKSRVQKFTPEGELVNFWYMNKSDSTGVPRLFDIEVDEKNEELYVFDTRVDLVHLFSKSGEHKTSWEFSGNGLAIDSEGFVYIADTENNKILKVKLFD